MRGEKEETAEAEFQSNVNLVVRIIHIALARFDLE